MINTVVFLKLCISVVFTSWKSLKLSKQQNSSGNNLCSQYWIGGIESVEILCNEVHRHQLNDFQTDFNALGKFESWEISLSPLCIHCRLCKYFQHWSRLALISISNTCTVASASERLLLLLLAWKISLLIICLIYQHLWDCQFYLEENPVSIKVNFHRQSWQKLPMKNQIHSHNTMHSFCIRAICCKILLEQVSLTLLIYECCRYTFIYTWKLEFTH